MVNKTLADFEQKFEYYYEQMSIGKMAMPYEMVVKGDELISKTIKKEVNGKKSLVYRFIQYRGDPLISDREVVAFYRAYKYFKDHDWRVVGNGPKSPHKMALEKASSNRPFGL